MKHKPAPGVPKWPPLARVIQAKIVITIGLWAPLILPYPLLFKLLKVTPPQPLLFVNLLGAAYCALLVCYFDGLRQARAGEYPSLAVNVGIVSNGLAALLLTWHGLTGDWSSWTLCGKLALALSSVATTLLTAALYYCSRHRFAPRLRSVR